MTGWMKKYNDSLQATPEPILLSQITKKINIGALIQYAKSKGLHVAQLTEQEKLAFVVTATK